MELILAAVVRAGGAVVTGSVTMNFLPFQLQDEHFKKTALYSDIVSHIDFVRQVTGDLMVSALCSDFCQQLPSCTSEILVNSVYRREI